MNLPNNYRTTFNRNSLPRHAMNLNSKNPHAVALGKMTSPAKKAAAQENGAKGGRPSGS